RGGAAVRLRPPRPREPRRSSARVAGVRGIPHRRRPPRAQRARRRGRRDAAARARADRRHHPRAPGLPGRRALERRLAWRHGKPAGGDRAGPRSGRHRLRPPALPAAGDRAMSTIHHRPRRAAPWRERGAALLTVLLLVAVMTILLVAVLDD